MFVSINTEDRHLILQFYGIHLCVSLMFSSSSGLSVLLSLIKSQACLCVITLKDETKDALQSVYVPAKFSMDFILPSKLKCY